MVLKHSTCDKLSRKSHSIRKQQKSTSHRTNWHEAAVCAVQIELRDYAHLLEFQSEYFLGRNNYRIDLLVIRKLCEHPISKNFARIFSTYNIFEIKGIGSSTGTDTYYKTIGYAGLFIDQTGQKNQYTALDISLTFLSMHFPRQLIKHLTQDRNLIVEKSSPGVYTVSKEIFSVQIIVTSKLPPEENLYLHCLARNQPKTDLLNRIAKDYEAHRDQNLYNRYLHQLTTAYSARKGENSMVCEGLLNLFGTSSEELIEKGQQDAADYYQPQIDHLSSQVQYLQNLLKENNIQFETAPTPKG